MRGEYNNVIRLNRGLKEGKDLMANIIRLSGGLKKGKDLIANGEILLLRLLLCLFNFK